MYHDHIPYSRVDEMINVTKTYLPPIEEYFQYLQGIWDRDQLTNYGPLVLELEEKLKQFLEVKHLFFVTNGTIALQVAIKAMDLHGDILTTPFSYVATTSSIVWEGCRPVFVDIDPETLCLNPALLEGAITAETTAIMPVHVYGYPCDVDQIKVIAERHHLKVIYDAAHAFGVRHNNVSILNYGNISTLSFHATKLFHTAEGGAIITNDDELAHRIDYMMNFGHRSEYEFWGIGINGKNSEFHAAMGLCILPRIPELIAERKRLSELYDRQLLDIDLRRPKVSKASTYNYAYYAVMFPTEDALLRAQQALRVNGIFTRRYFYPSLNTLNYVSHAKMPVAEDSSCRILCLPLSNYLKIGEVNVITRILKESSAS
jgi:dTDP-4-amino-4,6-dideoxygalactose transaminase